MAVRTWVSGVGDDANPGSRVSPCKTFAGAVSKTDRGGEINVTDPGGFGGLTITKSLTIDGGGTFSSVLVAGTNGFVINITDAIDSAKTVIIRNLSFQGGGTGTLGTNAIRILNANRVHIDHVWIQNFSQGGIIVTCPCEISITNCWVAETPNGISAQPAAGQAAKIAIADTTVENNGFGILARADGVKIALRDVRVHGSDNVGVFAENGGKISVESCLVTGGNVGCWAQTNGLVRVSNTLIAHNTAGLNSLTGGQVVSRQNNTLQDNDSPGVFTGTFGPS